MHKYWIAWLLSGWTGLLAAQTLTITDGETQEPLPYVTLISSQPRASTMTNTAGQADLAPFKGAASILIRSLGYEPVEFSYEEIIAFDLVIRLTPSSLSLGEVVLSATRWRQQTTHVPFQIITLSPREMVLQNPQTAADLLGSSGKVFIQKSQQGGGSPMIRGFATNRLIYAVDGVRMNTAIFRGGNLQNVINLDPFAVEQTEVLMGPGSVIYGSDAIGGVMSFQTLTPQLSLEEKPRVSGTALARYASANREQTGHVDINVGWKRWASVTSFSSWDFDHLKQGSHGPDDYVKDYFVQRQDGRDVVITQEDPLLQVPSGYTQKNLMQKLRFVPGGGWDLQYGFHYSATSSYGRYDRHNRRRNGSARYGEWNYGPQKWLMHHLHLHHSGGSGWYDQLTIRLARQVFEESRMDRAFNDPVRNTTQEQVRAFSANIDLTRQMGERNRLYYGLEYVINDVRSVGQNTDLLTGEILPGPSRYPWATWLAYALYLHDEWELSKRLTLEAGMRYSRFELEADFSQNLPFYPFPFSSARIRDGALTGSLGGVLRLPGSWLIKAHAGTAFRAPNVDDIGKVFDSEPGAVVVPNPELRAEYAYSFDLGLTKVFGDLLKVDLSAYYTHLDHALVRRDFRLNGQDSLEFAGVLSRVQAMQNAAQARVHGIQGGIEVKLPAGFSFSSDLNYQVGEEELDDGSVSPSRHAAPVFGASRLNLRVGKMTLQGYAVFQGERTHEDLAQEEKGKTEIYALDEAGDTYAPAWYTLNLKAMFALNETLTGTAGLENLTDQRYRPYSSGISGAGRNFILALRAHF